MKKLLTIFAFVLSTVPALAQKNVWYLTHEDSLRQDEYVKIAETEALTHDLQTVVSKANTISGDKHNYESLGGYFWPDPNNPGGPYIARDGYRNPEYKDWDYPKLLRINRWMDAAAKAYCFTQDERFYNYFVEQMDTWFFDQETLMYPTFDYSQFCPGVNGSRGKACGCIDAHQFVAVIQAVSLINKVKSIGYKRNRKFKKWLKNFAYWMENSDNGKECCGYKNNQGIVYDNTLMTIYLYTGNKTEARKHILSCYDRIDQQIDDEGRQPQELVRTKAFFYSVYNLEHINDFISIANRVDLPVEEALRRNAINTKVAKAFTFLGQYVGNHEAFPYQELDDWKTLEQDFHKQSQRFNAALKN